MGITRDRMYKRTKSGGARPHWHKKRKSLLGRPAARTRLVMKATTKKREGAKISIIRCRGGNLKHRALRLEAGSFAWGSAQVSHRARILSVVYNATSNELVRTNTLVKGAIVHIDAAPFQDAVGKSKDQTIIDQINEGRILARISSRPGQVGAADGYVLEGPELAFYQSKLQTKGPKAARKQ